jgi:hypothetical protein
MLSLICYKKNEAAKFQRTYRIYRILIQLYGLLVNTLSCEIIHPI